MQQSLSREPNQFSASKEIPHILWNQKVHYRIHKFQPTLPPLSQLDPSHTPTSHFLMIQEHVSHGLMKNFYIFLGGRKEAELQCLQNSKQKYLDNL